MSALPLRHVAPFATNFDNETDLARLVRKSRTSLLTISSVFPFDFFPDVLDIDENKVNVIHRDSWYSEHVHSILIEDITDVTVERNLFFATLRVVDSNNRRFPEELLIRKLRIRDAQRARKMIEGLMVVKRQGIDLSRMDVKKAISEVISIGTIKGME